jgi:hypothetical protein
MNQEMHLIVTDSQQYILKSITLLYVSNVIGPSSGPSVVIA